MFVTGRLKTIEQAYDEAIRLSMTLLFAARKQIMSITISQRDTMFSDMRGAEHALIEYSIARSFPQMLNHQQLKDDILIRLVSVAVIQIE